MKTFLSWSGGKSLKLAKQFRTWLPQIIQHVEPFLSDDIDKGKRWSNEIAGELATTSYGICFITPENKSSEWLHFEAGALSRSIEDAKLVPLLFGVSKAEMSNSPLSQFQMATFGREEMLRIIQGLGSEGSKPILPEQYQKVFDTTWPGLCSAVYRIVPEAKSAEPPEIGEAGDGDDLPSDIFADEIEAFEASLEEARASKPYKENPDFWETYIADKSLGLGVLSNVFTIDQLIVEHPDWFWPVRYKASRLTALGDFPRAKSLLEHAKSLAKDKEHKLTVARDLIALTIESTGMASALNLLRSLRSDPEIKTEFSTLVEYIIKYHGEEPKDLPSMLLREVGVQADPSLDSLRFNLAFKLTERNDKSLTAIFHYSHIDKSSWQRKWADNNSAVIYGHLGKPVLEIESFEKGAERGAMLSLANLSLKYLNGGFLKLAEDALARVDDSDSDATKSAARQRVTLVEKKEQKGLDKRAIDKEAKKARQQFAALAIKAADNWIVDEYLIPEGSWASASNKYSMKSNSKTALLTATFDDRPYTGEVYGNGFCYVANLKPVSAVSILDVDRSVYMIYVRDEDVVAVIDRVDEEKPPFWGLEILVKS